MFDDYFGNYFRLSPKNDRGNSGIESLPCSLKSIRHSSSIYRKFYANSTSSTDVCYIIFCTFIRVAKCPEMNRTVRKSKGLSGRKIYPLPDNVVSGNFVIALIFHVKLLKIVIFSGWNWQKVVHFFQKGKRPQLIQALAAHIYRFQSHTLL